MQKYGSDVLQETENLLNQPHSIELMEHVWGAAIATLEDIQVTKSHIRDAIEEYYSSLDMEEVRISPSSHHFTLPLIMVLVYALSL